MMSLLNLPDCKSIGRAALLMLSLVATHPSFADDDFSGSFAIENWGLGQNPGPNLIDTKHVPFYVTLKNYTGWPVSGSVLGYEKNHPAGTVTFNYSVSGGSQSCPASYKVGNTVTLLTQVSGQKSFSVGQNENFYFALNGQNEPTNFGCSSSAQVSFTISNFVFTPDGSQPSSGGSAPAITEWWISPTGTLVLVKGVNWSSSPAQNTLIFGSNLQTVQQMRVQGSYFDPNDRNTMVFNIPAGAPSGTLSIAVAGTISVASTTKLVIITDDNSCTANGFAPLASPYSYCRSSTNWTQNAGDWLVVGPNSTTSGTSQYPFYQLAIASGLTDTTVTLNGNLVLRYDQTKQTYGSVLVGSSATLALSATNKSYVGGYLDVVGTMTGMGALKTVGKGWIDVGGSLTISGASGNLWFASQPPPPATGNRYGINLNGSGASLSIISGAGIYQDLSGSGIGINQGSMTNEGYFYIQSPNGIVTLGGQANFTNTSTGTLAVGSSLKRAAGGVVNALGATFINKGAVQNNQANGISNNGVITSCGQWSGSNAAPTAQVTVATCP